jgi:hypothetical protein
MGSVVASHLVLRVAVQIITARGSTIASLSSIRFGSAYAPLCPRNSLTLTTICFVPSCVGAEILFAVSVLHRPLLPVLRGMKCGLLLMGLADRMLIATVQVMLIARFISCTNNLRTCSVTGLQAVLCVINFVEALV